ncbi:hypothetical protein BASA50_005051 [Batrachochytrium salamandrivorans]|uniref:Uncharacterized protein n=1 Tax=Batrachochytrium salamandrivorans TaxID=1357716 RepID=A0ABQ8FGX4_9FUNG|nr:hypothetical protein BASA50_005051 [Batrachochytrium salamandrivorans]KAH9244091.1 hypothetical protein BASA81_018545 [Batrachochytrium salamandrivorans]KAH9272935.1 hypothetical protein BASA83_004828 [Batrachochytrium salamandrivorans]
MRLISFAVISLLAITVSAHKPKRSSSVKYARQHDQDLVQKKIQELTEAYQEQQEVIFKIGELEEMEQEELGARVKMEGLANRLTEEHLLGDEKRNLKKLYASAEEGWKKIYDALILKQRQLKDVKQQRDNTEIKLFTLEENQKQMDKYNAENRDQMQVSPGTCYNKKILARQSIEACRDAENLLAASFDIENDISKPTEVMFKSKGPEESVFGQTREEFVDSRNKHVDKMEFMQRYCTHTKELQITLGWQPLSSRVGEVFKSFRENL